jgi:hypothetical protein
VNPAKQHVNRVPDCTALLILTLLFSCFWSESNLAASQVTVYPGQNLASMVNSYPSGTTFLLQPGVYRMQSVVPKNYDSFIGQSGVVLDGAQQLTSFSTDGSYWVAHVSVAWTASSSSVCDSSHPACDYPQDLFFDSAPLVRVLSLSQVGPGKWYLDYNTQNVYVGSNPSGHNVELSVTPYAFSGSATGVTISQLIVEKYAAPRDNGAINGQAGTTGPNSQHWTVNYCDVRLNHGMGLRIGDYMWVYHNAFYNNGQVGLGGGGKNAVIQNNAIYQNNYAGYTYAWGGGSHFANAYNLKLQYNNAYNNNGPGLWTDVNCDYVLIEHNDTSYNKEAGIFAEISYNETIRYNYITYDGVNPKGSSIWWGAGILVNSSPGIQIYGNIVKYCMNGIGGIQADRGTGAYGPYLIQNLNVYGNTITQVNGTAEGIVKASDYDDSVYTSWNNHFQNETYYLSYPLTQNYFYWLDAYHTLAWWTQYASLH